MPRALTMQRTIVPPQDRKKYLERLRQKRDYYTRAKCHFRVYEEAGLPNAFIEFYEADDPRTLAAAHEGAPDGAVDAARVYTEVELS